MKHAWLVVDTMDSLRWDIEENLNMNLNKIDSILGMDILDIYKS